MFWLYIAIGQMCRIKQGKLGEKLQSRPKSLRNHAESKLKVNEALENRIFPWRSKRFLYILPENFAYSSVICTLVKSIQHNQVYCKTLNFR